MVSLHEDLTESLAVHSIANGNDTYILVCLLISSDETDAYLLQFPIVPMHQRGLLLKRYPGASIKASANRMYYQLNDHCLTSTRRRSNKMRKLRTSASL